VPGPARQVDALALRRCGLRTQLRELTGTGAQPFVDRCARQAVPRDEPTCTENRPLRPPQPPVRAEPERDGVHNAVADHYTRAHNDAVWPGGVRADEELPPRRDRVRHGGPPAVARVDGEHAEPHAWALDLLHLARDRRLDRLAMIRIQQWKRDRNAGCARQQLQQRVRPCKLLVFVLENLDASERAPQLEVFTGL